MIEIQQILGLPPMFREQSQPDGACRFSVALDGLCNTFAGFEPQAANASTATVNANTRPDSNHGRSPVSQTALAVIADEIRAVFEDEQRDIAQAAAQVRVSDRTRLEAGYFFSRDQIECSLNPREHYARALLGNLGRDEAFIDHLLKEQNRHGAERVLDACRLLTLASAAEECNLNDFDDVTSALQTYLNKAGGNYIGADANFSSHGGRELRALEKAMERLIERMGASTLRKEMLTHLTPALLKTLSDKHPDICASQLLPRLEESINSQALSSYLQILKSCENSPLNYLREIDKLIHLLKAAEPERPGASPATGRPDARPAAAGRAFNTPPIVIVNKPVQLVTGCRGQARSAEPPAAAAVTVGDAAASTTEMATNTDVPNRRVPQADPYIPRAWRGEPNGAMDLEDDAVVIGGDGGEDWGGFVAGSSVVGPRRRVVHTEPVMTLDNREESDDEDDFLGSSTDPLQQPTTQTAGRPPHVAEGNSNFIAALRTATTTSHVPAPGTYFGSWLNLDNAGLRRVPRPGDSQLFAMGQSSWRNNMPVGRTAAGQNATVPRTDAGSYGSSRTGKRPLVKVEQQPVDPPRRPIHFGYASSIPKKDDRLTLPVVPLQAVVTELPAPSAVPLPVGNHRGAGSGVLAPSSSR